MIKSDALLSCGWVILHPDGHMELGNFHSSLTYNKYHPAEPITIEEWMRQYRPKCELHRIEVRLSEQTIYKIKQ